MKLKPVKPTVQKTIPVDVPIWDKIVEVSPNLDFKSEAALLNYLLKLGIEAAQEIIIDQHIESTPPKNTEEKPKKEVSEKAKKEVSEKAKKEVPSLNLSNLDKIEF